MIDPTTTVHPDGFKVHDAVIRWLETGQDFKFKHLGVRADGVNWQARKSLERHVYECVIPFGALRIRFAIALRFDEPVADVWVWPIYGHTGTSSPTFERVGLYMESGTGRLDVELSGGSILHGQGVTVRHATFDFVTGRLAALHPAPRQMSEMAPTDATQTGGDWAYFGTTFPERCIYDARRWFYSFGNYPGNFVHSNGAWVKEADYPDAVLHGGTHFHEHAGTHWIAYTHPADPWKDRAGRNESGAAIYPPDRQHLMHNNLAQAYLDNPSDVGLRWLVLAGAHRVLFQMPGRDKGTTHHHAGQARTQGRVRSDLVWLMRAVAQMDDQIRLLGDLSARLCDIHVIQAATAMSRQARYGYPWPHFETSEDAGRLGWAPAEIGIWFAGLRDSLSVFRHDPESAEITHMMERCSRLCFDAFALGGKGWRIPYKTFADGGVRDAGSSGTHFAWLAATSCRIEPGEESKLAGIYALRDSVPERFRG